jgi:polysaccharide pyruvyl transferase CsaB
MRIILLGYYGCGNAGDELALGVLISEMKKHLSRKTVITVLSHNPQDTASIHEVESWNIRGQGVRRAINEGDVWIVGGGSVLQDSSSLRSLLYYAWILKRVVARKKPLFFLAQGVGPFKHRVSRRLASDLYKKSSRISVRDVDSYNLLTSLNVTDNLEFGADLTFLLNPPSETQIKDAATKYGLNLSRPILGLSLRPWRGQNRWLKQITIGLAEFIREQNAQVLLLPMEEAQDRLVLHSLEERIPGALYTGPTDWQDIISILAGCRLVVSMRLHALILSGICGINGLALSYDPKVDSLAKSFDWSVLPVDNLESEVFLEKLKRAWENQESGQGTLLEKVWREKNRAEKDLQGLINRLLRQEDRYLRKKRNE